MIDINKVLEFGFREEGIVGTIWEPEDAPMAVVVLVHGITDYHSRYKDFAEYLNNQKIAVIGFDLPGHGLSGGEHRVYFGKNGIERLQTILQMCISLGKDRYPDVPIILLGMSLGSYLVRTYLIQTKNHCVDGGILVGTGEMSSSELLIAKMIVQMEKFFYGDKAAPQLIQNLAFGSYNQKFEPNHTSMDWLIKDPEALNLFMSSPLRGEKVTIGAFKDLLNMVSIACSLKNMESGKRIPVLLCSGEEDAVGGFCKKVKETYKKFSSAGYDTKLCLYKNSRHDVLHDNDHEDAYSDIVSWIHNLKEVAYGE